MRYETRSVRIGEDVGPVDWSHPDAKHMPDIWREAEKTPERFHLLINGMFTPRAIYSLRMYDGWPYWRPTPAVLHESPLGWLRMDTLHQLRRDHKQHQAPPHPLTGGRVAWLTT